HVTLEWARIFNAIVVYEDATTLIVAAARPEDAIVPARELAAQREKNVELRIALDITLARTIRVAFKLYKDGERYLAGPEVDPAKRGKPGLAFVHPDGGEDEHRRAQRALAEEAARNIERQDELPEDISGSQSLSSITGDWQQSTITTTRDDDNDLAEERT